jgi:hypothetical protein
MHFFCELHADLMEEFGFGPVTGSETTKFNITSKFKLNGTSTSFKAFACQKGMMIVQNSVDTSRVNLIIKPSEGLEINTSPVKYYIYRGILKSSLLSGANIIPKTATNKSAFLDRFWQKWDTYLLDNGLQDTASGDPNYVAPPSPKAIGYDDTLSNSENVEALFNNNHVSGIISTSVVECEWIGDFGATGASFEIITDTEHFYKTYNNTTNELVSNGLNLEYLRKEFHIVEIVADLVADTSISGELKKRLLKEEILSYIDPCAFYGMHSALKKGIKAYIGGNVVKRKKTEIYNDILALTFNANKNKVYLDVRSELGYSYNFHQNYSIATISPLTFGDQIQFKNSLDASFTNAQYQNNGWPIFFVDNTLGSKKRNKIDIKLRIDDNENPLLYIEGDTLERDSHFLEVRDSSDASWSKAIRLEFPNVGSGSSKLNIAQHIKLHYFRQENKIPASSLVFPFNNTLDSVFAPIDLPFSTGDIVIFSKVDSSKYSIAQDGIFSYLSKSTIYKEGSFYTFFTTVNKRYKASKEIYPTIPKEDQINGSSFNNTPTFPRQLIINKIEVLGTPSYFQLDLALYSDELLPSYKEDVFLLSITESELNSLRTIADLEGLVSNQPRRIVFTSKSSNVGANGVPYISYDLQVQGIKIDNTIHTTTAGNVKVYTLNEKTFNSKDFGDQVDVDVTPPDAGTLLRWSHSNYEEYDHITPYVTAVENTGFIELNDHTDAKTFTVEKIKLSGSITYPVDSLKQSDLSNVLSFYPMIMIVHGNGQYYKNYKELSIYLAKNGFIVNCINCTKALSNTLSPIADLALPSGHAILTSNITHYFKPKISEDTFGYSSLTNNLFKLVKTGSNWDTPIKFPFQEGIDFEILSSPDRIRFLKTAFSEISDLGAIIRSELVLKHLEIMRSKFPTQVENNWALLGHSRGGEAVVMAANKIANDTQVQNELTNISFNNLNAVISLAPTDQYPEVTWSQLTIGSKTFDYVSSINSRTKMNNNIPFYVICGSRDYDIYQKYLSGAPLDIVQYPNLVYYDAQLNSIITFNSGVSIYDRSVNGDKILSYVHGATHNGFISQSPANSKEINKYKTDRANEITPPVDFPDAHYSQTEIDDILKSKIKLEVEQQSFTRAFMNAFFRRYLFNELVWAPYFKENYIPASVGIKRIDLQYEPSNNTKKVVMGVSNSNLAITNVVKVNGNLSSPQIKLETLRNNDGFIHTELIKEATSGHDTSGVTFKWNSDDLLSIEVAPIDQDASSYTFLSFRIGNASISNDLLGLMLMIEDNNGNTFSKNLDIKIGDIRSPLKFYKHPLSNQTGIGEMYFYLDANLNIMQTIRISITDLVTNGLNSTQISKVNFKFPSSGSGKIIVDNILFTD